jgi:UDP-N-acetylmuramyl pentapeptide phosphotransferase/UDP-N-acetylglucosamine-1-phosphate transferase
MLAFIANAVLVIIACFLSLLFCIGVKKSGVVDHPDGERKQQAAPVARLGGVPIALAFAITASIALPVLSLIGGADLLSALELGYAAGLTVAIQSKTLLLFIAGAFLIGLWDDLRTAPTALKLLVLSAICAVAATYGLTPEMLTSPFGDLTLPLALIIGSALWLLVFTNAANFMDGSNGLAIGCLSIMITGLAIAAAGVAGPKIWLFPLLGAVAGFMIHNLRGTLYAGDAGALGLGAVFAGAGLVSGLEVWTVATLALPFLVDVLMTLIWRAKHGKSWLKPHLDHAYQRLRVTGWSHIEVAVLYWGLSIVGAVAAYIAAKAGGYAPFAMFWGLLIAGIILWTVQRRTLRS